MAEEEKSEEISEEEKPDIHIEEMNIEPESTPHEISTEHDHQDIREEIANIRRELEQSREHSRSLETRLSELHAIIAAKRERSPDENHWYLRTIGANR